MNQSFLLFCNVIVCSLIILRVLAYRKNGAKHNTRAAWFAWVLLVACFAVIVRTLTGSYLNIDWAELLINISFLWALMVAKGNVNKLFLGSESKKKEVGHE